MDGSLGTSHPTSLGDMYPRDATDLVIEPMPLT
jgi:hypothetical protein